MNGKQLITNVTRHSSNRLLWLLISAIGLWLAFPHTGHASPNVSWNGPACQDGSEDFIVCSEDSSDGSSPCFESHFQNGPDQIEIYLIAICQASKTALAVSESKRDDALERIVGLGTELAVEVEDDPSDAANDSRAVNATGQDLQALGASMITYSSSQDPADWNDVEDNLSSLTDDAQVLGD